MDLMKEAEAEAVMAMIEERPDDKEVVLLNDAGVWLQEEEIGDMIENLMIGDDDGGLNENDDIQIIDDEDGADNKVVMVQQDKVEVQGMKNTIILSERDFAAVDYSTTTTTSTLGNEQYWWEAYALASQPDNYTEYNWCFQDDIKMWEFEDALEPSAH